MKRLLAWILLFALTTGCCRVAELPRWPVESNSGIESTLYRFRLEHSDETKFSGLLALKPREDGMWTVLLDATGVPLIKMLVQTDGAKQIEYRAAALRNNRLPELLGKLVEYIYFTPAGKDCPWYALSRVCTAIEEQEQSVKWKKFGPLRLWEITRSLHSPRQEEITLHLNLSRVSVHLLRMDNGTDK